MHAAKPTVTTLEAAWPIYRLQIRSERLVLRLPTDDDLLALMDLAKAGIHPPDEMPFAVPWSIGESPEFERGFLSRCVVAKQKRASVPALVGHPLWSTVPAWP